MNYTPLHCHTDASTDGAGTVEALVAEAKRLDFKALAMTDHGTLANAVAFWMACKEQDIKPILGVEAYLMYKAKRHHVTLLSMNETGFNNLIHLNSLAHSTGYQGGYPTLTLDDIYSSKSGILALTGCASSAIHEGEDADGEQFVGDLHSSVDRLAVEVMFVGSTDVWTRPLNLAQRMHFAFAVTNDTHYPCQSQFPAHQSILKARKGFTYDSKQLWLKTAQEIIAEGSKHVGQGLIEEGLEWTNHIAAHVEDWDMRAKPSLPAIAGVETIIADALKAEIKNDVRRKGEESKRVKRLKYEFQTLKEKGFLDYVYILWDIIKWAKQQGILVGPGRGSGGGSYLLYLLGITRIDPLEHGLLFERFINPDRSDYPDVDVDFDADRRQEVVNYAKDKWGAIPIATYSAYSHKSAVHDIARTLAIPKTLETAAAESTIDSPVFEKFIKSHPDAQMTYDTMIGQIRHRGKHAAGVVIVNRPVPIERAPSGELVAAWADGMNTKHLSSVGIVKYDILGLTALTQLSQLQKMTGVHLSSKRDEPEVYDLFCKGDVAGIFQWSGSDGIRTLTQRIQPRNFNTLTTINALYRPGALDAGTAENYPEYMEHPREMHPRIDKHLKETHGVLCYQEQVMAVIAEVTGGNLAIADSARKLISKGAIHDVKWMQEIDKVRVEFLSKGKTQGFNKELLDDLWGEIYKHGRYSFNKSHAAAYTTISYDMAYYKVHHREEFTVVCLQHDKSNAQTYILDAVEHGLSINMPDINRSSAEYELVDDVIYLPLSDVSFLGEEAVRFILEERAANGPFLSYEDFNKRVPKKKCNSRARSCLERIGAFHEFTDDPKLAMPKYEEIPVGTVYRNQLEILKYVVPSKKLLNSINELRNKSCRKDLERFAGFVQLIKEKKSAHGAYRVYYLSPYGSFWVRGQQSKIAVGSFVGGTKNRFGQSKDVASYRLKGD